LLNGRSTYASLLLQDGVELLHVSQQLGHHSPGFTLSQSAHRSPKERRGEVNRLDTAATSRNPGATSSSNEIPTETETARNPFELRAVRELRGEDLNLRPSGYERAGEPWTP